MTDQAVLRSGTLDEAQKAASASLARITEEFSLVGDGEKVLNEVTTGAGFNPTTYIDAGTQLVAALGLEGGQALAAKTRELDDARNEIARKGKTILDLNAENAKLDAALTAARAQAGSSDQQATIDQLTKDLRSAQDNYDSMKQQRDALSNDFRRLEIALLEAQKNADAGLRADNTRLRDELAQEKQDATTARERVALLENDIITKDAALRRAENALVLANAATAAAQTRENAALAATNAATQALLRQQQQDDAAAAAAEKQRLDDLARQDETQARADAATKAAQDAAAKAAREQKEAEDAAAAAQKAAEEAAEKQRQAKIAAQSSLVSTFASVDIDTPKTLVFAHTNAYGLGDLVVRYYMYRGKFPGQTLEQYINALLVWSTFKTLAPQGRSPAAILAPILLRGSAAAFNVELAKYAASTGLALGAISQVAYDAIVAAFTSNNTLVVDATTEVAKIVASTKTGTKLADVQELTGATNMTRDDLLLLMLLSSLPSKTEGLGAFFGVYESQKLNETFSGDDAEQNRMRLMPGFVDNADKLKRLSALRGTANSSVASRISRLDAKVEAITGALDVDGSLAISASVDADIELAAAADVSSALSSGTLWEKPATAPVKSTVNGVAAALTSFFST